MSSLETIFQALNEAHARYLVVGGVAVMAYGHARLTQDLDLVLDLSADSLSITLKILEAHGYRPIYPVSIYDFANPALRQEWISTRNMTVFGIISSQYPDLTIDIFPKAPFAFDQEYAASAWKNISPTIQARVVSLPRLIALKREADRHRDRDDIEQLRRLHPDAQV